MQNLQRPYGEPITGSPYGQYQYVTVTFPSSPNTDLPIKHSLTVVDADSVNYQVVKSDRAGLVYNDQSATHTPWQTSVIFLRCSVASLTATLLLTVARKSS